MDHECRWFMENRKKIEVGMFLPTLIDGLSGYEGDFMYVEKISPDMVSLISECKTKGVSYGGEPLLIWLDQLNLEIDGSDEEIRPQE